MYVVDAMDGNVKKAANNSLLTHIPSLSAQELVDCDGEFNQVIEPRHIHACMYVCFLYMTSVSIHQIIGTQYFFTEHRRSTATNKTLVYVCMYVCMYVTELPAVHVLVPFSAAVQPREVLAEESVSVSHRNVCFFLPIG